MLRPVLTILLLAACAPALAVYKCETGGKLSYSDAPCANGKTVLLDSAPQPADAAAAHSRLLSDKAEAGRLEHERHRRENQEDRERQQAARAATRQHKRCDALALRQKWADEDALHASGKAAGKSKRRAHRAAEKYTLECGKK